ncbi:carboxyl-terminal PDZ ligand of neuronal nitric oxide synthase protein-like isoform X2 [Sphaerodactylus townsendi]|uniref:carboxyl-terminal PDZ ligand of neuronal nitric oxide synthase protein-like isoform X2 n=1 Tax=Sphaerodactylus townsendi TaxID=933632 RepID=UPI002026A1CF|nr:carboxyl-terminal PDZ ligand of neuronal nitric oxide synthase protein-like isoform X2 [Sphaerodactylus townsendi]
MPVKLKNRYNLVDDAGDSRVPLHNEEAFQHGIHFQAKYIGSLDVPRPSSRVEIVAAMRRIRYEFKAKNIKKKKVSIVVSVDGVKVILRKKQKRNEWTWDEGKMVVMHDPVYRIFYVSHDSQDLKIFSYIARDGTNNSFRCNVFKSKKKTQAMRVVRTVGQAFEVCHKLSLQHALQNADGQADGASNNSAEDPQLEGFQLEGPPMADRENILADSEGLQVPDCGACELSSAIPDLGVLKLGQVLKERSSQALVSPASPCSSASVTPLASQHCLQLLRHQLLQQQQQTQVAAAQVQLLKDQLSSETTARIEAQARVRQLLLTNRDLLQHVSLLVKQLKELEIKVQLRHPVDRSLQNLTLAQSLSLNLKNHYSLEINLPSTSTPASVLGSPVMRPSTCESYLNLANLEKGSKLPNSTECEERLVVLEGPDGLRSVEGSESTDCSVLNGTKQQKCNGSSCPVQEERSQPFIPKLNPPPPTLRRRSSKTTSPSLEAETVPPNITANPGTSSFTSISIFSLSNLESESRTQGGYAGGCVEDRGHLSQEWAREDRCTLLARGILGQVEKGPIRDSDSTLDSTRPFSLTGNDTCLHISLSEEELDNAGACTAHA